MKVLRIYDHLGELKKEFNLYVEGEDFKWIASYPEPVWLGTVTLEEAGTEPKAEPLPLPEVIEPEPMVAIEKVEEGQGKSSESVSGSSEQELEEVKDATKRNNGKRSRVKRSTPSASPESTEGLHQGDSPGATNQGD